MIMNKKKLFLLFIVSLLVVCFSVSYCAKRKSIKIGLAATITGAKTSFGRYVRNGVLLAVEQINSVGGIKKTKIELIVKDDKGIPEEAFRVDKDLIEKDVIAIIGHYLSVLAVKTVPLMNKHNMLMISPTVSTSELSGIDDNFIRIAVSVDKQAEIIAKVLYNKYKLKNIIVVYDAYNINYTKPYYHYLSKEFIKVGGENVGEIVFNSREKYIMSNITKKIIKSNAKGLFIITNAYNGAMICQHLRNQKSKIKIMVSEWAFSDPGFIENGGKFVEGALSLSVFNQNSSSKKFLKFKKEYEERFREKISMGAQFGYEATQILLETLTKTRNKEKIKKAILDKKKFTGLNGDILIDKFGDTKRVMFLQEIKSGSVKTIDTLYLQ